jgi:hypothetical protein
MSNVSITVRQLGMYFESFIVTRVRTVVRSAAVTIPLLAFFSLALSASTPGVEPTTHKDECASSPRGPVSAGTEIKTVDQVGRRWVLHAQKGRLFIVSFLAVSPDTAPTSSRRQVVSIQSMQLQYSQFGLGAAVIDESKLNGGSGSSQVERVNAWYDWHLDPIPLLADEGALIARAFAVCSAPTTLLLDSNGKVLKRWDSIVNAGGLAQEIQAVLVRSQTKAGTSKSSSPSPIPSKLK